MMNSDLKLGPKVFTFGPVDVDKTVPIAGLALFRSLLQSNSYFSMLNIWIIQRRDFLKKATATGAAILAAPVVFGTDTFSKRQKAVDATTPFKLKYAPGIGMFHEHAGNDILINKILL